MRWRRRDHTRLRGLGGGAVFGGGAPVDAEEADEGDGEPHATRAASTSVGLVGSGVVTDESCADDAADGAGNEHLEEGFGGSAHRVWTWYSAWKERVDVLGRFQAGPASAAGGLDGRKQVFIFKWAVMTPVIDEEPWRTVDAAADAAGKIFDHPPVPRTRSLQGLRRVEPQCLHRVPD